MGGIAEIMVKTSTFIIGGFLSYNCSIEIMKELYRNVEDVSLLNIQKEYNSKTFSRKVSLKIQSLFKSDENENDKQVEIKEGGSKDIKILNYNHKQSATSLKKSS